MDNEDGLKHIKWKEALEMVKSFSFRIDQIYKYIKIALRDSSSNLQPGLIWPTGPV